MNAEKWHEDTTKGESPPSLMSLWARAIESTEFAARLQQPDPGQSPQSAPDEEPDRQETRASLLRAIEGTEFATQLQHPDLSSPSEPTPSEPTPSKPTPPNPTPPKPTPPNPTKSDASLPASTLPLASPPSEQRVSRPLPTAPPPVAASSIQQPELLPDHPRGLTPAPQTKSAARLQQPESEPGQRPQLAPDEEPDSQETRASLLRAIESTEFAAQLQQPALSTPEPPPFEPWPEPTKSAGLPASRVPVDRPPWDRRVNRPLSSAPPPVAAFSSVQQRDPLPDHPPLLTPNPQTKSAPRPQQRESDAGQRVPQLAPDGEPDSEETRASLLRAIASTEFATHLQQPGLSKPEPLPPEPTGSEPTKSDTILPAATVPVSSQPWDRRLNRALSTAPPSEAASSAVQKRGLLPNHPLVLMPAPKAKSAVTEKAQESARPRPPALVEDHFSVRAFLARLKGEMRCLAQKIGPSIRTLFDNAEERLSTWLQSWLALPPPQDPRRSQRLVRPPLVAYYWTGGTPRPQAVIDISSSGLYLATHDRWLPGTVISMALQRTDQEHGAPGYWIPVNVMVIRQGDDGFGGAFVPSLPRHANAAAGRVGNGADKEALERFVKQLTVSAEL